MIDIIMMTVRCPTLGNEPGHSHQSQY